MTLNPMPNLFDFYATPNVPALKSRVNYMSRWMKNIYQPMSLKQLMIWQAEPEQRSEAS